MNTFAIIMAGGSGTRFWPLSRKKRPKQLLPLATDESLLAATVRRIEPLVARDRVLVVTSAALAKATREEAKGTEILEEPTGRNTAPCIGWACLHVRRRDPEGVVMVLPADQHVGDEPAFVAACQRAIEAAKSGGIVTIGIRPTRPETGYGYLEVGEETAPGVHRCVRFVEKPNKEKAEEFLAAGRFLWNGGMFFFRADEMLRAIEAHMPALHAALERFDAAHAEGREAERVAAEYASLPSVSIDHGVMEHAKGVRVVPASFDWSDLGSFATAWELAKKDAQGNATSDRAVSIDAERCFVRAPKDKIVALIGVRDLVVVDTGDALLVMPRERGEDIRKVVDALTARGDGDRT